MDTQRPRLFKFNIFLIYLVIFIAGVWVSYSVYQTGSSIQEVSQRLTAQQLPSLNNISALKHWITEYERILYEFYATVERKDIYPKLKIAKNKIEQYITLLERNRSDGADIFQVRNNFAEMEKTYFDTRYSIAS